MNIFVIYLLLCGIGFPVLLGINLRSFLKFKKEIDEINELTETISTDSAFDYLFNGKE